MAAALKRNNSIYNICIIYFHIHLYTTILFLQLFLCFAVISITDISTSELFSIMCTLKIISPYEIMAGRKWSANESACMRYA